MKWIAPLFLTLALSSHARSQSHDVDINLQNNFGYTIVSVSEAMGIPEYSRVTDKGIVESNQFNYHGLIQLLFRKSEQVSYGPEVGFNRLYYWEEKHIPRGLGPRWRWGTIWTGHVGGLVRLRFTPHYYVLTGASLHHFFNGSGSTIGIPLAIGREVPFSEVFSIPIEFRIDVIFGDDIPIGFGAGVGLKFNFGR
jgi:hypothetical protein